MQEKVPTPAPADSDEKPTTPPAENGQGEGEVEQKTDDAAAEPAVEAEAKPETPQGEKINVLMSLLSLYIFMQ